MAANGREEKRTANEILLWMCGCIIDKKMNHLTYNKMPIPRDDIDIAKTYIIMLYDESPGGCPKVLTDIYNTAVTNNFQKVFNWFIHEYSLHITIDHVNQCVIASRYDMMITLLKLYPSFYGPKHFEVFMSATTEMLSLLDENGFDIFNNYLIELLVSNDKFEEIKFIHALAKAKNRYAGCTTTTYNTAVAFGLEYMRWFHEECNCDTTFSSAAYEMAKTGAAKTAARVAATATQTERSIIEGNLIIEIFEYLRAAGIKVQSSLLQSYIADPAHFTHFKWIYEHIDVLVWEADDNIMDNAISNGALEIVQYLHESQERGLNHYNVCPMHAMESAISSGSIVVLEWLKYNCKCAFIPTKGKLKTYTGADIYVTAASLYECPITCAVNDNNYPMMVWCVKNTTNVFNTVDERGNESLLHMATIQVSLPVLQYLTEDLCLEPSETLLDIACLDDPQFNMGQYIHDNYIQCSTTRSILHAVIVNDINTVRWLLMHRTEGYTKIAISKAATLGYYNILVLLTQPTSLQLLHGYEEYVRRRKTHTTPGPIDAQEWKKICTSNTMHNVIRHGYVQIARYLIDNFGVPIKKNILLNFKNDGRSSVDGIVFIYDNFPYVQWDDSVLMLIIHAGNLDVLKKFCGQFNDGRYIHNISNIINGRFTINPTDNTVFTTAIYYPERYAILEYLCLETTLTINLYIAVFELMNSKNNSARYALDLIKKTAIDAGADELLEQAEKAYADLTNPRVIQNLYMLV